MARYARQASKTGIYHIMVRGINGQSIFHDEDDYKRYLETLSRISEEGEAQVLGYCLMSNHLHLLIHEIKDNISLIMKRLGGSYAYWYNWKYERKGYVFQVVRIIPMTSLKPVLFWVYSIQTRTFNMKLFELLWNNLRTLSALIILNKND